MIEIKIRQVKDKKEQEIIFDKAVKKFKKICNKDGLLQEMRDRRYFKKPSQKRREQIIARKRIIALNQKRRKKK